MAPRVVLSHLPPSLYRRVSHVLAKRYYTSTTTAYITIPFGIAFCIIIMVFRYHAHRARLARLAPPTVIQSHGGSNQPCRNTYCIRPECLQARENIVHDPAADQYPAWRRPAPRSAHGCDSAEGHAMELGSHEVPVVRPADESVGNVTVPPPAYVQKESPLPQG